MTDSKKIPENIFTHYETWPPEKITDDEVKLLRDMVVVFETTKGTIKVSLLPDRAPIHCANLVKLVQDGFYDGLAFHRIIPGFMSQGGDPEGTGCGGPGYDIPAEIGAPHVAGAMAGARLGDNVNPGRRSSGSQFYWCHDDKGCRHLDGQYTVYGKIIEGLNINTSLNVTYDARGPIKGVEADKIKSAKVELA